MVIRYYNGDAQRWLSGCGILASCSTDQGPTSTMSQIYNEVEGMMKILYAEIGVNFVTLLVMACFWCSRSKSSSSSTKNIISIFEVILEALQVAGSVLALRSLDQSAKPVDELYASLVGKYSEDAGLCLLPCCGGSNNNIAC
jgi:hypothetical protein